MSFLDKIKYAIGFGSDDTDDDVIKDDPDYTQPVLSENLRQRTTVKSTAPSAQKAVDGKNNIVDSDLATAAIFEHVVKTFTDALPDFLSRSVDPALARKQLFDSLDADVKKYLLDIQENADKNAMRRWQDEKIRLQANMREIESRVREFDETRNELSRKHLESERQRKSLASRIQDLNQRILTLEAEKEQYELETKSLLNKLKVASVVEKENEELRSRVTELENSRPASQASDHLSSATELNEARLKAISLEKQMSELTTKIDDIQKTNKALTDENSVLRNNAAQKEAQHDIEIQQLKHQIRDLSAKSTDIHENDDIKPAKKQPKLIENDATPIEDILSDTDWGIPSSSLKGKTIARNTENGKKGFSGRNKLSENNKPDSTDSQLSLF